jgi:hypothetical protein
MHYADFNYAELVYKKKEHFSPNATVTNMTDLLTQLKITSDITLSFSDNFKNTELIVSNLTLIQITNLILLLPQWSNTITKLEFNNIAFNDETFNDFLKELKLFTNLKNIKIHQCRKNIVTHPNGQHVDTPSILDFWNSLITTLNILKLEEIHLNDNLLTVTDEKYLSNLESDTLKVLDLSSTNMNNNLDNLSKSFSKIPNLTKLDLSSCSLNDSNIGSFYLFCGALLNLKQLTDINLEFNSVDNIYPIYGTLIYLENINNIYFGKQDNLAQRLLTSYIFFHKYDEDNREVTLANDDPSTGWSIYYATVNFGLTSKEKRQYKFDLINLTELTVSSKSYYLIKNEGGTDYVNLLIVPPTLKLSNYNNNSDKIKYILYDIISTKDVNLDASGLNMNILNDIPIAINYNSINISGNNLSKSDIETFLTNFINVYHFSGKKCKIIWDNNNLKDDEKNKLLELIKDTNIITDNTPDTVISTSSNTTQANTPTSKPIQYTDVYIDIDIDEFINNYDYSIQTFSNAPTIYYFKNEVINIRLVQVTSLNINLNNKSKINKFLALDNFTNITSLILNIYCDYYYQNIIDSINNFTNLTSLTIRLVKNINMPDYLVNYGTYNFHLLDNLTNLTLDFNNNKINLNYITTQLGLNSIHYKDKITELHLNLSGCGLTDISSLAPIITKFTTLKTLDINISNNTIPNIISDLNNITNNKPYETLILNLSNCGITNERWRQKNYNKSWSDGMASNSMFTLSKLTKLELYLDNNSGLGSRFDSREDVFNSGILEISPFTFDLSLCTNLKDITISMSNCGMKINEIMELLKIFFKNNYNVNIYTRINFNMSNNNFDFGANAFKSSEFMSLLPEKYDNLTNLILNFNNNNFESSGTNNTWLSLIYTILRKATRITNLELYLNSIFSKTQNEDKTSLINDLFSYINKQTLTLDLSNNYLSTSALKSLNLEKCANLNINYSNNTIYYDDVITFINNQTNLNNLVLNIKSDKTNETNQESQIPLLIQNANLTTLDISYTNKLKETDNIINGLYYFTNLNELALDITTTKINTITIPSQVTKLHLNINNSSNNSITINTSDVNKLKDFKLHINYIKNLYPLLEIIKRQTNLLTLDLYLMIVNNYILSYLAGIISRIKSLKDIKINININNSTDFDNNIRVLTPVISLIDKYYFNINGNYMFYYINMPDYNIANSTELPVTYYKPGDIMTLANYYIFNNINDINITNNSVLYDIISIDDLTLTVNNSNIFIPISSNYSKITGISELNQTQTYLDRIYKSIEKCITINDNDNDNCDSSSEATISPSGGTTQLPSGGKSQSPSGGTTQQQSGGTTLQQSGGTTQQQSGGTTQSPSGGTTQPPSGGTAQPPSEKQTTPSAIILPDITVENVTNVKVSLNITDNEITITYNTQDTFTKKNIEESINSILRDLQINATVDHVNILDPFLNVEPFINKNKKYIVYIKPITGATINDIHRPINDNINKILTINTNIVKPPETGDTAQPPETDNTTQPPVKSNNMMLYLILLIVGIIILIVGFIVIIKKLKS